MKPVHTLMSIFFIWSRGAKNSIEFQYILLLPSPPPPSFFVPIHQARSHLWLSWKKWMDKISCNNKNIDMKHLQFFSSFVFLLLFETNCPQKFTKNFRQSIATTNKENCVANLRKRRKTKQFYKGPAARMWCHFVLTKDSRLDLFLKTTSMLKVFSNKQIEPRISWNFT